ncbi:D-alanine--D-alanine ligase family protein [Sansalvadorimonas verongulae]|uniref:D-alanine--D-alanine ligase family protein n=1 Tax=Sansalvadorimonas verongulae TaxID=2172824 RepID=UPI0012BD1940|nr:D-alanine--D-alanine ligase [Sansalvadorimonas verongulae]MTI14690.1 D-alanine--D-alanine ligase [Sansalvadorimonas verongulae]
MPDNQPVIVILCGGPSSEAAVSRLSAGRIQGLMERHYDHLHVLELDKHVARELERINPDVVFPLLHGPFGEDGTIQGLLDIMGIPYIGSGVRASAVTMDKYFTKQIIAPMGISLARSRLFHKKGGIDNAADTTIQSLGLPVVIKPRSQGSTIAISAAATRQELVEAFERAFDVEPWVMAEEFIKGREITVSVLDRPMPTALPVLEVRTSGNSWFDYDHKYTPGLSEHLLPAPIPESQYRYCQEWAVRVHNELGLQDLSRADFIVPESGEPVFLETNSMPGMTPTSMLPDAVEHAGLTMLNVISTMVENALNRGSRT